MSLVQGSDGHFYGTTQYGGPNTTGCNATYKDHHCGNVFEITPDGTLTTLHSFDGPDGGQPVAGLVQRTNGNLYGTRNLGGAGGASCPISSGCGTIFEITPSGTFTTLISFNGTDGAQPFAGLMQATDGTFYGTTSQGGASATGTVFNLSVGLGPFVTTNPTSGGVGTTVTILGNNLTDSTSVTFNGVQATLTVVSSTEITTTVPSGATTGKVQVEMPSDTLTSNVNF